MSNLKVFEKPISNKEKIGLLEDGAGRAAQGIFQEILTLHLGVQLVFLEVLGVNGLSLLMGIG